MFLDPLIFPLFISTLLSLSMDLCIPLFFFFSIYKYVAHHDKSMEILVFNSILDVRIWKVWKEKQKSKSKAISNMCINSWTEEKKKLAIKHRLVGEREEAINRESKEVWNFSSSSSLIQDKISNFEVQPNNYVIRCLHPTKLIFLFLVMFLL